MRKILLYKLSIIIIVTNLASYNALSQVNDKKLSDTLIKLNEITLTESSQENFKPIVRVVASITGDEIKKLPASNLLDVLNHLQGVDLRSRGQEGVQADVNILGGTFDQSIILLNGVNVTDPQTGHHSMVLPVDILQIEKIELLQGPGAWSGGTSAFSGAINIVTKTPNKSGLNASLAAGDFGFIKSSANIEIFKKLDRIRNLSLLIGGSRSLSKGYKENTDFDANTLFSSITLSKNRETISLQIGIGSKAFGANSFYSSTYPEQFEKLNYLYSSLAYNGALNKRLFINSSIYTKSTYDMFELFRYEKPEWYAGANYHRNNTYGLLTELFYKWNLGSSLIGLEIRESKIISNVLGDSLDTPVHIPKVDTIYYIKGKSRLNQSIYTKQVLQLGKFRLGGGLSISKNLISNSSYTPKLKVNYGLSLLYNIKERLELGLWLNKASRNPTFTDLYYKSPTQSGNSSLKEENSITFQSGLKYSDNFSSLQIGIFYRLGYNIIDWIRETSSEQWRASNLTKLNTYGVNFSFEQKISSIIIESLKISYSYNDVSKNLFGFRSLYSTDFVKHKLNSTIVQRLGRVQFGWNFLFEQRAGTFLDIDLSEKKYSPFLLTDLRVKYNIGNLDFYSDILNLFNVEYSDIGNIIQPGRWFKCGIVINL